MGCSAQVLTGQWSERTATLRGVPCASSGRPAWRKGRDMSEYQDQGTWFEVHIQGAHRRWVSAGENLDADTREGAEENAKRVLCSDVPYRIVKRRGLASA